MRLFIVGQSDSHGTNLPAPHQPWPHLLVDSLRAKGVDVELVHIRFFAAGPNAADFVLRKVKEADPDVVLLILSAYACAVSSVHLSVRRRFGERAERWYQWIEKGFDRRTFEHTGPAGFSNSLARRIARRVLGAQTVESVEDTTRIYADIMRGLAQREGTDVLVMADTYLAALAQKYDPVIVPSIDRFRAILRPICESYRFPWADAEVMMSRTGNREEMFSSDLAHKTPLGHARYAEDLEAAFLEHGIVKLDGAAAARAGR